MCSIALAGFLYFAAVFVVAFVLGAVRTFALEPMLGETLAVACEAPVLILAMYAAATHIVPRAHPPRTIASLVAVGLIGLVLQQAAEFALIAAAGETLAQHAAYLRTPAGMIYLAALGAFVLMPLVLSPRNEKRGP